MKTGSIQMRAFNFGGAFEFRLPNGKKVLIDPWFTGSHLPEGRSHEDIDGADYILLTHAHYDHDSDVGYLTRKFGAKVIAGVITANALLKYHRIPYDNLFVAYPGSRYTFDDFTLQCWQAKHNPSGERTYDPLAAEAAALAGRDPAHAELDHLGSMDSLDYMITTNNHFSILMASGRPVTKEIFRAVEREHPNVLLRQSGVRENGVQVSADKLADLLVRYGAQLIFPFHQDIVRRVWSEEKLSAYFEDVARAVREKDPGAAFVVPEAWKWYQLGIFMEEM